LFIGKPFIRCCYHSKREACVYTPPRGFASSINNVAVLGSKATIVTYNAEFDKSTLERDAERYGLAMPQVEWQCLMLRYAEYVGDYSEYWHDYRWYPLPEGTHRALGDAKAALELMRHMAAHRERLDREQGQEVLQ